MMNLEYQSTANVSRDGSWQVYENRFFDLVRAIWPSDSISELSRKISFQDIEALVAGGVLSSEHEAALRGYLSSLPGYGTPGYEKEAEHHHGFLTANIHRRAARSAQG
ncbi:hypothetical protein K5D42_25005 [Pseudomonas cichorii]|nr:hypothetical protein [Pseudomonas cichorii]MBX8493132.1 hypothetical protein [Pseudomonas cichorii]